MMLALLREEVLQANLELVRRGLVLYTFGNASGIDRAQGLVVIKPSGVPYETMQASDLVVTDLSGKSWKERFCLPSDLPTHLVFVSRIFRNRRSRTHTFEECDVLGAGRKRNPMLRDDTCRLFSRAGAVHKAAHAKRNSR